MKIDTETEKGKLTITAIAYKLLCRFGRFTSEDAFEFSCPRIISREKLEEYLEGEIDEHRKIN